MKMEEVAVFAGKFATHNERIIITFKNNEVLRGHFISNSRLSKKMDNLWNFVILRIDGGTNTQLQINGDDIANIKKILIF